MELLRDGPVLVWPRSRRVGTAVRDRAQLVVRPAMGRADRLSAVVRRDGRRVRRRREPARCRQRDRERAVEHRDDAVLRAVPDRSGRALVSAAFAVQQALAIGTRGVPACARTRTGRLAAFSSAVQYLYTKYGPVYLFVIYSSAL